MKSIAYVGDDLLNQHRSGDRGFSQQSGSSVYVPVDSCQSSVCECTNVFFLLLFFFISSFVYLSFANRTRGSVELKPPSSICKSSSSEQLHFFLSVLPPPPRQPIQNRYLPLNHFSAKRRVCIVLHRGCQYVQLAVSRDRAGASGFCRLKTLRCITTVCISLGNLINFMCTLHAVTHQKCSKRVHI